MRRAALLVLASAGVANAAPWTVLLEGGGEADTNVQRVETGPGLMTERIGAGVMRLGGRVGKRDRALGGAYAFLASALTRVVADTIATTENVTLFTTELRFLRPVDKRPISVGLGAIAADAQPLTDDIGARTFRNLGADALLVLHGDAGSERPKQLTLAFGARSFIYKEVREFDWDGPVASARLALTLWQPSGSAKSLELAAYVGFEARDYASSALADACPPNAPPMDTCSAGTSIPRSDRVQRVGLDLVWTSKVVAAAGYQLMVVDSNSYGQSLVRHRATASATRSLPGGLYATALGILQIDQYPDGLVIKTDNQNREFTSLDDENRSSLQVRVAKPVSEGWSIEGRAAIWRNLGGDTETSFRRASLYAGAVYSR